MNKSVDRPKVSVIIPSYNHEKYIAQTLHSLYKQTYDNLELILLDDGSKDLSFDVALSKLKEIGSKFTNVICIKKDNEGICKTLNKGLELMTGDYVFICASDDYYFEDFVEKQVDYLESNPNLFCSYTDGYNLTDGQIDNNEMEENKRFSKTFEFHSGDLKEFMLKNYLLLPTPSFIYKKELFEEVGFYDDTLLFEDVDMFLRISRHHLIGCIEEPLFIRRIHETNSGRNLTIILPGLEQILQKVKSSNDYNEQDKTKLVKNLTAHINFYEKKMQKQNFIKDNLTTIVNKNKKIIVWGTGSYASDLINNESIKMIDFFVESVPSKQYFMGKKVVSPNIFLDEQDQYFIIIASHQQEIIEEILNNYRLNNNIDFI